MEPTRREPGPSDDNERGPPRASGQPEVQLNEPEDITLVQRFKEGDETAFNMIVQRYSVKILTLCTYFLKDLEEAHDACQEVFLKIHRALHKFRGDSKLSTWIHTIGVNTCKNRISFWKRLTQRRKEYDRSQQVLHSPFGPEERAEQSERARIVREHVLELPEKYRLVIILKDLKGLSYEEIARVLGTQEGTVKSRLHRAREKLAARLAPILRSG